MERLKNYVTKYVELLRNLVYGHGETNFEGIHHYLPVLYCFLQLLCLIVSRTFFRYNFIFFIYIFEILLGPLLGLRVYTSY